VTGGTFTITFDGETTGNLDADATTAEVETELELLTNIDDVTVTGDDFVLGNSGNEMLVEFVGVLVEGQEQPQMTLTLALTGGGFGLFYDVATVTQGANVVQTLTLDARVSGGTFTLAFGGDTTGPIAWNATVGEVETALNGLASINTGGGDVTVSTTSTDPDFPPEDTLITAAPFLVNFTDVANAAVSELVVDHTNLE